MGRVDSMYGIPPYSGDSNQFNYKTRGAIFDDLRIKRSAPKITPKTKNT